MGTKVIETFALPTFECSQSLSTFIFADSVWQHYNFKPSPRLYPIEQGPVLLKQIMAKF